MEQPHRDPVIEAYKQHVDRTLLRENLKLSPEQRLIKLQSAIAFIAELKEGAQRARLRQQASAP